MKRVLIFLTLTVILCLMLALSVSAEDSANEEISLESVIIFSVASIAVAVIIFLLCVIPKYKKKQRGKSYPLKEFTDLKLTGQYDIFITKTVTRRRYRNSSSNKK